MCGRYVLPDKDAIGEEWTLDRCLFDGWFKPVFNVPPTSQVPMIARDGGRLFLRSARWGLIPYWWSQEALPSKTFNARSEEAASKPVWRDGLRYRRCLMPARGWYEWNAGEMVPGAGGRLARRPYFISCPGAQVIAFAGLWSVWEKPGAEPVVSCAMLTKASAPDIAFIHERMPVVLKPERQAAWLDAAATESEVADMMADAREDVAGYPVSARVGNVRNDEAELMERV